MSETKYIVPLPADVNAYTQKAVLQIEPFNEFMWKVVAPLHPCIEPLLFYRTFRHFEVPGPARLLSNTEYAQVLVEARASIKDINAAQRWLDVEEKPLMLFYTMAQRLADALAAYHALYSTMDQARQARDLIRATRAMMQQVLESRQETQLRPLIEQLVVAIEPLSDPLLDVYVLQAKALLQEMPADKQLFYPNGCGKDED